MNMTKTTKPDETIAYPPGTDHRAWKERQLTNDMSGLLTDYGNRKHRLKPPDGTKEELTAGIAVADQTLQDIRKLRDQKMEADAVLLRGGISKDMHTARVGTITDTM